MNAEENDRAGGCLYVVATPIGNLGDLSPRAVDILQSVHYILAEDTRISSRMLKAFGIATRLKSCHEHNENRLSQTVVEDVKAGHRVALISDAGTPLMSDPGYLLVREMHAVRLSVRVVPGPCALTAALSVAGLATRPVWFEGFLPARHEARVRRLQALQDMQATLAFYEAPHRLLATLDDMCRELGGGRVAAFARELSKRFEQTELATLAGLHEMLSLQSPRGEFVILVEGAAEHIPDKQELERVVALLIEELPTAKAASIAATITGARRNEAYQAALRIKSSFSDH